MLQRALQRASPQRTAREFRRGPLEFPACRVWGSGFRVQGLGFRVSGFGFRVSGFGFRAQEYPWRGLPTVHVELLSFGVPGLGARRTREAAFPRWR